MVRGATGIAPAEGECDIGFTLRADDGSDTYFLIRDAILSNQSDKNLISCNQINEQMQVESWSSVHSFGNKSIFYFGDKKKSFMHHPI